MSQRVTINKGDRYELTKSRFQMRFNSVRIVMSCHGMDGQLLFDFFCVDRCLPGAVPAVRGDMWHALVPAGDSHGPVYSAGGDYLLEEAVPTGRG